ncbi:hypothetical protein CYMTET_37986 [Cymbomonas tetramitiformis]|uniref:Uncharacterized protein n=1 Tax=Cymbomonas tetramitiformis TaxID=36881 RepID=A0AAE0CEE2_9CHLO|nr:hypothetical protein CYMTET_37986 [Cymbomonas tetramitiformis]
MLGDAVGDGVGELLGDAVGEGVGDALGDGVGDMLGDAVGDGVGELLGMLGDAVLGEIVTLLGALVTVGVSAESCRGGRVSCMLGEPTNHRLDVVRPRCHLAILTERYTVRPAGTDARPGVYLVG